VLRTSSFVDDVLFPNNGGSRPISDTMHTFSPVCQVVIAGGRQATLFGRDRRVAALGA